MIAELEAAKDALRKASEHLQRSVQADEAEAPNRERGSSSDETAPTQSQPKDQTPPKKLGDPELRLLAEQVIDIEQQAVVLLIRLKSAPSAR